MGMQSCTWPKSVQGDHAGAYAGIGEYTINSQLHTGRREQIVDRKQKRLHTGKGEIMDPQCGKRPAATSLIIAQSVGGGGILHSGGGKFALPCKAKVFYLLGLIFMLELILERITRIQIGLIIRVSLPFRERQ